MSVELTVARWTFCCRLAIGLTRVLTRAVVPATELVQVQQPEGTSKPPPIPGKVSVSYGFGGTPPLDDMDEAQVSNF